MIEYRLGNDLPLEEVLDLYASCTLGARRPLADPPRMAAMLAGSNLVVSAWDGPLLVGLARSLTDRAYVTYVSDLAVRESHQKGGIGRQLLARTQAEAPLAQLVLLSAPQAVGYYPRIGFKPHPSAWVLKAGEPLIRPSAGRRGPGQLEEGVQGAPEHGP